MGYWNSVYYPPTQEKSWLDQVLTFFYTIGHWLGQWIVGAVNSVVPALISEDIVRTVIDQFS